MRKWGVLVAAVVILAVINVSILQKERHLADGRVVYLELAPVDPRSLMQGDYMTLNFAIQDQIRQAQRSRQAAAEKDRSYDGQVVVHLNDRQVAEFVRLAQGGLSLEKDEMLLAYRVRNQRVKFATNAFFFEEGSGDRYEPAQYGLFRVNDKGEPLLVSLHDADLKPLGFQDRAQIM
jgi:uncharacterized membrane-anchored protein